MASENDFFQKKGAGTVTTLAAPGKALGATSITVGSTANYPTETGITIGIRQVDTAGDLISGTYTEWTGVVASGTSITINATPVYGSDQVYPAGSTTQVYIPLSSTSHNRLVDGILTHANQDGLLLGTPESFVGTAGDIGGAWKSWTPTWTNLIVTSSTVIAKYTQIGKTVEFYVSVTLSGGDKPSGSVYFSLPLTATTVSVPNGSAFKGTCDFEDDGVNSYAGRLRLVSTTLAQVVSLGVTGSNITYNGLSGNAPFSWGNGDGFFAHGFYEAA